MRTCEKILYGHAKLKTTLALVAVAVLATLPVALAQAGNGGTGGTRGSGGSSDAPQARAGKARLVHGKAVAPSDAPRRVVRVIAAANRIASACGPSGFAAPDSSTWRIASAPAEPPGSRLTLTLMPIFCRRIARPAT